MEWWYFIAWIRPEREWRRVYSRGWVKASRSEADHELAATVESFAFGQPHPSHVTRYHWQNGVARVG